MQGSTFKHCIEATGGFGVAGGNCSCKRKHHKEKKQMDEASKRLAGLIEWQFAWAGLCAGRYIWQRLAWVPMVRRVLCGG